ncbi:unnamed protein product [Orchesella dallaii]|uniref:Lipase domain-containing protein n=1 Tax=Orchesella dallaii TaxID=48710 RepID=A0ABP1Q1H0_9HEXA
MMRQTSVLILGLVCWSSAPALAQTISKDVNDLKYFYFPNANQKTEITFNDRNSIESSQIRANTPTTIIIDGFLSDSTSPMSNVMKDIYTARGDKNVIILDWGRLSGAGMTLGNPLATASAYISALGNVGPVGQRLAEFIEFLRVSKQIEFSAVTIIGHSLGAHIAGATGVNTKSKYGQTIARITGLDPAGPFFSMQVDRDKRLHKGDAAFVDIYHSNRGTLGDSDHDTGDLNLYINGGNNQPGCEEADSSGFAGYCSHSYSWKLYQAANTNSNLRACPCTGDACLQASLSCSNGIRVGSNLPTSARGRYHITAPEIP